MGLLLASGLDVLRALGLTEESWAELRYAVRGAVVCAASRRGDDPSS
jgi:hypothetical protein